VGSRNRRLGLLAGAICLAALVGVAAIFNGFEHPGPLKGNALVVIPKGAGVSTIAGLLKRHGIVSSDFVFKMGVRLTGNQGRIQAGEYSFQSHVSPREIKDILVAGKTVVRKFTLPEGMTSTQAIIALRAAYGLSGPIDSIPAEGVLFPDTYHYSYGDTRTNLIARMEAAMINEIAFRWGRRAQNLPFKSPHDAIILASIVEKETGVAAERAKVAAVFINRLRLKMPLQSDPTVAYGVAIEISAPGRVLGRALTRADLKKPNPFNTYLHKDLPPEPIANPGRAAFLAVLHPLKSDALYFVADGKGGHVFAKTLKSHNRNVRQWRKIRDRRLGKSKKKSVKRTSEKKTVGSKH
jgi:UPF0755 protein